MGTFACMLSNMDNVLTHATVTVSSQAAGYLGADAVKLPYNRPWRTTGLSGEWIEFDLGMSSPVDFIAIANHNLTRDATITVTSGSGPAPGENAEAVQWRARDAYVRLIARSLRYWRVTFSDITNPYGFIQVGYLPGGRLRVFPFGVSYGDTTEDFYTDLENTTEFGITHLVALSQGTTLLLPFNTRTKSQLEDLRRLYQEAQGKRNPLFLIPDLDRYDGYFGRFTTPLRWQDNAFAFDTSLEFRTDSPGRIVGG
jgi:hypothetical protein